MGANVCGSALLWETERSARHPTGVPRHSTEKDEIGAGGGGAPGTDLVNGSREIASGRRTAAPAAYVLLTDVMSTTFPTPGMCWISSMASASSREVSKVP